MSENEDLPLGGTEVDQSTPWHPWSPREVAELLRGVDVPWCVTAGWAIDLHLGVVTRVHEDTEIAVPTGWFPEIRRALWEFDFDVVGSGHIWPLEDQTAFDVMHQTWVRNPTTGIYHLDVFRDPHDGDVWICRREGTIRRPYTEVIKTTKDGIPYMAPEIVLLFKAKHDRAKDNADFAAVLPSLDQDQRLWLTEALQRVHPGHHWLIELGS